MERAELLCDVDKNDEKRKSWVVLSVLVGVVAPMLTVVPFVFALEDDSEDPSRNGLMVSSVWLGIFVGYVERFVYVSILSLTNTCFAAFLRYFYFMR